MAAGGGASAGGGAADVLLYERGRRCDYFILILQGRAQVTIGAESMVFEAGPFSHFGTQAFAGERRAPRRPRPKSSRSKQCIATRVERVRKRSARVAYTDAVVVQIIYGGLLDL